MNPFIHSKLRRLFFSGTLLLFSSSFITLYAQVEINEDTAVNIALKHYPQVKVSNLMVDQQNALKGAGFNLYNPEIIMQSPLGNKMQPAILQRFDFPTVYAQQIKLQGEAAKLSETQRDINFNELKYNVRNA